VIRGVDFSSLQESRLSIGKVEIQITGKCHPCSRMEENLGPGGLKAMANKAGLTAKVLKEGKIQVGDTVSVL
jgi:MOSC domain-containing protein YiiM